MEALLALLLWLLAAPLLALLVGAACRRTTRDDARVVTDEPLKPSSR